MGHLVLVSRKTNLYIEIRGGKEPQSSTLQVLPGMTGVEMQDGVLASSLVGSCSLPATNLVFISLPPSLSIRIQATIP